MPPRKSGPYLGHVSKDNPRSLANYRDSVSAQPGPITRGKTRREGIPVPEADESWHPLARSWFNSLKLSGQSALWEASDWATGVCAAKAYDIFLRTHNASILSQFVKLSERLAVTVSDRNRARISLDEPEPEDADEDAADNVIHNWQARLNARKSPPEGDKGA